MWRGLEERPQRGVDAPNETSAQLKQLNDGNKMTKIHYASQKLSEAIYIFTTHEGDARRRIAAALGKLKAVKSHMLPEPLDKSYSEVMAKIEKGRSKYLRDMPDYNLPNIRNSTASKLITEIVKIQYELERLLTTEE